MTPITSAPARHARVASSGVVIPQTLQSFLWSASIVVAATPRSSATSDAGSGARISASPTSTTFAAAGSSSTSPRVATPDKDAKIPAKGPACSTSRDVVPMSSWNVWRFRLLMPISLTPGVASATSISASVCTSTRGSIEERRQNATNSASCVRSRHATMSKTASAPCARASRICASRLTKSFRSIAGLASSPDSRCAARRAVSKSSSEPRKCSGSVNTEMSAAPADAYVLATPAMSASTLMGPFDGDARLNSAATATVFPLASAFNRATTSIGAPSSASNASTFASRAASASAESASARAAHAASILWSVDGSCVGSPKPRRCPASSSVRASAAATTRRTLLWRGRGARPAMSALAAQSAVASRCKLHIFERFLSARFCCARANRSKYYASARLLRARAVAAG
mmetsp:Transcript_11879/g.36607  ORF Transcript_11879/g.36607 Transcript_11879/m.36607 type:complete len:404 (-) Transcript_11879:7-1218(-)